MMVQPEDPAAGIETEQRPPPLNARRKSDAGQLKSEEMKILEASNLESFGKESEVSGRLWC